MRDDLKEAFSQENTKALGLPEMDQETTTETADKRGPGRPAINGKPMTPAERKRAQRARDRADTKLQSKREHSELQQRMKEEASETLIKIFGKVYGMALNTQPDQMNFSEVKQMKEFLDTNIPPELSTWIKGSYLFDEEFYRVIGIDHHEI